MPQVRRDAPRAQGARQGRVAGAVPRVLRPRPLAQGHGPARVPRARGGRPGGPRRHACAGGTLRECAGACGVCPGTSRLVRTGPSEAVGRALAPPGRGQPSPAKSTARTSASRRPAGGPGRRRRCPGSRGARRRRARARHIGPRGVRGRRGVSSAWRCATHARPEGFLARLGGGPAGEARPLPRLVPVGQADEGAGRRQGGHPVGPGGDGELRQHAVRPREGAAAPLVLLGG